MKKKINFGLVVLLIVVAFTSCKKNKDIRPSTAKNDMYSVKDYILSLGYKESSIIELDDYFLVEGDILFPKKSKSNKGKGSFEKQAYTNNLVSQTNVNSMSIFIDPSMPTSGDDNWRPAISQAIGDMNNIGCSKVYFFQTTTSNNADIVIKADGGTLPDNTQAAAGFPSSNKPYNTVLVNLDFYSNKIVSQPSQRYNIVHELGHCIGLRHTNWQARGESAGSDGANLISGTSNTDAQSVMNGGTALYEWNGFSANDILAIRTLYPSLGWQYSSAGTSSWLALASGGILINDLRFGDFDGDGKTDVFNISGSQWRYSSGGTSSWINLSSGGLSITDLRFGDFDGDGKTDVFNVSGGQWRYSSGGTSSWINLAWAGISITDLGFGDFNGDGKTDVFNVSGGQWRYSSGGTSSWINLSSGGLSITDLGFGDFNGDGKTDVFNISGSQWRYSSGGTSSWINLSLGGLSITDLRFGDFNGDGKTDVFNISGSQWRYSSGGTSSWINLSSAGISITDLGFGDFNGDQKTDVFTTSCQ